jgi:DNA-binding PadR family transcriptional regulator
MAGHGRPVQGSSDSPYITPRTTIPTEHEIFGNREFSEIDVGLLQMQILWILSHKPMHGYELMKVLNDIKKTKITQGTLYPALQSLEGRRLIKGKEQDRKVIYDITPEGRKVMNETCMDFSRTFFGIFQSFVCHKCLGHDHDHSNKTVSISDKK